MAFISLDTAIQTWTPLGLVTLGIAVYAIFIFKFYHFIAKRDIVEFNLRQYQRDAQSVWLKKILDVVLYLIEYILLLPLVILVWFAVFSIFLLVLSESLQPSTLLLIAMAIVTVTRIVSYYNEELATDIAKLLPLVLLATFLTDVQFFSAEKVILVVSEIPGLLPTVLYYLFFAMMIEFVLRIGTLLLQVENADDEGPPLMRY